MQSFDEATKDWQQDMTGSLHFNFGDGYELWLEKLVWDDQYYLAVYKDQELLTPKVVVKPGKK